VYLTGGSGFVGSNVARVFGERHGASVIAPGHAEVDLVDAAAVARSVADARPDAIVHCAILNDSGGCTRTAARRGTPTWGDAQPRATGVPVVLVSTDWVFDGTQAGAREDEPPNPINAYGFLKAASELVVDGHGAVARIAGVQGVHWARPQTPRRQDAGFGYLAASIVDALRGRPPLHGVGGPGAELGRHAHAGQRRRRADVADRLAGLTGTFHCCGGEAVDRAGLARQTAVSVCVPRPRAAVGFGPPDHRAVAPSRPVNLPARHDPSTGPADRGGALDFELPSVRTPPRPPARTRSTRGRLAARRVPASPATVGPPSRHAGVLPPPLVGPGRGRPGRRRG
jgi:dTDP-4-dehydrorhamnose reductase